MLDNDVIVITKWDNKSLKNTLLAKNKIEKVEVAQNDVEVKGGTVEEDMVYPSVILGSWTIDKLLTEGNWDTYENTNRSGAWTNDNPMIQGVQKLQVNSQGELTATLIYKFENVWGATNYENFSVSNILTILREKGERGTTSEYIYGFSGTLNHSPALENYIKPTFAVAGNWITMTVPNAVIWGNYVYTFIGGNTSGVKSLYLFEQKFTITYGGFEAKEVKVVFGDEASKLSYAISNNGFYETHSRKTIMGENEATTIMLADYNANKIISTWKNGKQYVEATVPCIDYYNENGDKLVDLIGEKNLIEIFDKIAFKDYRGYVFTDINGNPKIFRVVGAKFLYSGRPKLEIKCIEV